MVSRGAMRIPRLIIILVVLLGTAGIAGALDKPFKYPVKVNVSDNIPSRSGIAGMDMASGAGVSWDVAAGQSRSEIFCPKRGYSFAMGIKPHFTSLTGGSRVSSRGGEGSLLNFHGHLRLPDDKTLWDFYSSIRLYDKIGVRIEYAPWTWSGIGHIPIDANFSGLGLKAGDAIQSDLGITTFTLGGDYDVSFGRDLVFGPNADIHVIKWNQRVAKDGGSSVDFSQTILQPAIGAHVRYEPTYTGYFSWFKPSLEARFSWMSFDGLGLSTWDASAGIAPPVSRNVDAGFRLGYKQWRLDGARNRIFTDVTVEGPYMDFALHF